MFNMLNWKPPALNKVYVLCLKHENTCHFVGFVTLRLNYHKHEND